jgi:hypothetical protein
VCGRLGYFGQRQQLRRLIVSDVQIISLLDEEQTLSSLGQDMIDRREGVREREKEGRTNSDRIQLHYDRCT